MTDLKFLKNRPQDNGGGGSGKEDGMVKATLVNKEDVGLSM
jgi:hypothetical protein